MRKAIRKNRDISVREYFAAVRKLEMMWLILIIVLALLLVLVMAMLAGGL